MSSKELIKNLEHQLNETYGRFKSIMPRALKGVVNERISLDPELSEDEDVIDELHGYITYALIDTLWDTVGDMIGDISQEAKMEFNLGDYKPTPEEREFAEKETELRERDNEGL